MSFDIKQLKRADRTKWFTWNDGIRLHLRFVPKMQLERAMRSLRGFRGQNALEAQQNESRAAIFRAGMVGWEGLTVGKFAEMTGADLDDETLVNTELEFSQQNAVEAMRCLYGFEDFIVGIVMDPSSFRDETPEDAEERLGN